MYSYVTKSSITMYLTSLLTSSGEDSNNGTNACATENFNPKSFKDLLLACLVDGWPRPYGPNFYRTNHHEYARQERIKITGPPSPLPALLKELNINALQQQQRKKKIGKYLEMLEVILKRRLRKPNLSLIVEQYQVSDQRRFGMLIMD